MSILILDEIDRLFANARVSLCPRTKAFFSPTYYWYCKHPHAYFLSLSSLLDSVTGVSTLHFRPYDTQQLLSILQSHLKSLTSLESPTSEAVFQQFLPVSTLTLLSRNIAAHTGDVRSLFEVLRGAIDLAVTQPPSSDKDTPLVTPVHILAALKSHPLKSRQIIDISDEWYPCDDKSGRIVASSVLLIRSIFLSL
ncbi:hypothetical protein F5888DRAFT_1868261 [Russula emetica]|nr:hypothetical protein F5888DRAFT_1812624 [Russula emetica]KAF8486731.1 hypothetical protein F5888DRAFT_1810705 [Russula emetica]KAF8488756.1 hypothetical protein F5888DRAFT_1809412 [Russula emetica]KAF8494015.1 hypothetical protein F5888DRAFT_1805969 [Russula emetica]KAF8498718.1 hypothetical protein F5888DRAFT_1802876 [Russula emetica]